MKILLAVDGSAPALQAVRHALQLVAEGLRAEFVLANVQEPPSLYEVIVAHDAEVIDRVRHDAAVDLLADAQSLLDTAGAAYSSVVAGGAPAHMLVDLLEEHGCTAVVMGARGAGDPGASGLGSVAEAVLRHAGVAVTVVRARAEDAAAG